MDGVWSIKPRFIVFDATLYKSCIQAGFYTSGTGNARLAVRVECRKEERVREGDDGLLTARSAIVVVGFQATVTLAW